MSTINYYEKYENIMDNPKLNPTFDELLGMDIVRFAAWVSDFREAVVHEWDVNGQPPRVGYDKAGIIDNFRKLKEYLVSAMATVDELTGKQDVIRNTTTFGNAVNQWFPTMMKTRITYSNNINDSKSIYDYFASDDLLKTFITYAHRHFHRDSFYHYSAPVSIGDEICVGTDGKTKIFTATGVQQFIDDFETKRGYLESQGLDYFLCPVKEDKAYTGYNASLKSKQNLVLNIKTTNMRNVPAHCKTNVTPTFGDFYAIRLYKKGQRLFPVGLKAFRVSFCQYAVNFPPLTARYLYEKYLPPSGSRTAPDGHTLPIIIFDPSAGWGGRLLGAMSVNTSDNLLYIGTDPNRDHCLPNAKTKYHDIASFFNTNVRSQGSLFPTDGHAYHIFQSGSEEISKLADFQKYKGSVDLVFTSPPYFAKEVYSEDPEQSCHKFSDYNTWRTGFLEPTLKTAYEWLKPGGYILWNVSDIVMSNVSHPLVQDSIDILNGLGMTHVDTLKLALAQMPGGNRLEETGNFETVTEHNLFGTISKQVPVMKGKMKYFCEVKKESGKGKMMLKYEPILVFRKPG